MTRERAALLRNGESAAVEMVAQCLNHAIQCGASDIHFHPRRDRWEVSLRLDGVLQPALHFPRSEETDPVSRLMSMAELPCYLGDSPQEGPLRFESSEGTFHELRLGVFPTVHGHRAVLRVMDRSDQLRDLAQLGLDGPTLQGLQQICEARDGWLLVAGPSGSGKTTTLYACLTEIAQAESVRSVMTIEDPIEAHIDSISQTQLRPSSGLTLAAALKAAVRQDAEVLLVSEIRDEATAEAVLSASMTGHLCFSSIHASSIGATLRRLSQMNLPSFAIRSGLRGILCQRLLRRRCEECPEGSSRVTRDDCSTCRGTGYVGRFPIAQLIDFESVPLEDEALRCQTAKGIDHWVQSRGVASLAAAATRCLEAGLTDRSEVFRVLGRRCFA